MRRRPSACADSGLERVVGLVLTPHGSSLGSQEYLDRAAAAVGTTPFVPVGPWYPDPGFVDLLADAVARACEAVDWAQTGHLHRAFAARARPGGGRHLPRTVEESARLVAEAAGLDEWSVAWQSAGRTPEPWLGPDVRDEVRRLASEGAADAVVLCPIGFVADHLEVLYDLDVEVADVAADAGLAYARTASLNDDPAFIAALAGVVMRADGSV